MTRGRGANQRGELTERSGAWLGRFNLKHGLANERLTFGLGRSDEVTKEQAQAKLREIVKRCHVDQRRLEGLSGDSAPCYSKRMKSLPGLVGTLSELLVCVDLLSKGWCVYRAMDPQADCDVIATRGPELVRVEVKTDGPRIKLKTKRGKFDILAVVDSSNHIRYLAYGDLPNFDTIRVHRVQGILQSIKETLVLTRSAPATSENIGVNGGVS